MSNIPEISNNNMFQNDAVLLEIFWSNLVDPKLKIIGFGGHGHVQKSENHEDEGFVAFPNVKSKSY